METKLINLGAITVKSQTSFLIIEDDKNFNDFLFDSLRMIGFESTIYQSLNLLSARDNLEHKKIDFIICDWNLPDGEGVTLLKAIRKLKKFNDTPFLMITAKDDVESMLKSSKSGGSEYLVKPFSVQEFEQKLVDSWKFHALKSDELISALKEEIKNLRQQITGLEDENLRLKRLLK